jgi:hypothetical protein
MKGPSRWSSHDSGLQGELGALMRYAREQKPSAHQVEALTERVLVRLDAGGEASSSAKSERHSRASRSLVPIRRAGVVACAGLIALGSAALWMYARKDRTNNIQPNRSKSLEQPSGNRTDSQGGSLTPAASRVPTTNQERRPVEVKTAREAPQKATLSRRGNTAVAVVDPANEVAILERARRVIEAKPREALRAVGVHEAKYPEGLFREEREALAIEALQRLGLRDKAVSRFDQFIQRYPFSAYRPRLEPLLRERNAL